MAHQFTYRKRVAFADTDMVGIVHFANFFRYMEEAEHAFYRSLGFAGYMPGKERSHGWPRVHAEMDYKAPLHFEDEVEIQVLVEEKRARVLKHVFLFRKAGEPRILARGRLTVLYIETDPETKAMRAIPMPAEIGDRIEAAPKELLHMEE